MSLTAYELRLIDEEAKSLLSSITDGTDYIDADVKVWLDEDPEFKAWLDDIGIKAITPGGRLGDDSPFSTSRTSNWVARAGGLPKYIREVAHALVRNGHTVSRAINMAIGIMKNWAHGKGNVSKRVRAAAMAALAQWNAMRAATHAKKPIRGAARAIDRQDNKKSDWDDPETKESIMEIQYKEVGVKGLSVDDEDHGIVTTIVSVTGIVDNVKDNILPGAYAKTLAVRKPKGVWSHDWSTPISKTLEARELMPGDENLPKTLRNGEPWPSDAGALLIKTQFNLNTQQGKDAFENVKFFGDDQEWSIGYQVPTGGATQNKQTGVREIETLDLYEYSPVLFGAMPQAVTRDVKTAQLAYKSLQAMMEKSEEDEAVVEEKDDEPTTEVKLDMEPYDMGSDDEDEDEDDDEATVQIRASDVQVLYQLLDNLTELIETITGIQYDDEDGDADDEGEDATGEEDMRRKSHFIPNRESKEDAASGQAVADLMEDLTDYKDDIANLSTIEDLAGQYDDAVEGGDNEAALEVADKLVEELTTAMDEASEQDTATAIEDVAKEFGKILQEHAGSEETTVEEAPVEDEEKSFVIDMKDLTSLLEFK